jgi:hypothetical protein
LPTSETSCDITAFLRPGNSELYTRHLIRTTTSSNGADFIVPTGAPSEAILSIRHYFIFFITPYFLDSCERHVGLTLDLTKPNRF